MAEPTFGTADLTDDAAFRRLADIVREWRASGRTTTTAGIKSALQASPEGFDERTLGFSTFAEFLEAADAAGYVGRLRQPNGHWLVTLPGEAAEDVGAAQGSTARDRRYGDIGADSRFKPDVWATFMDWRSDHRRLWDVEQRRALLIPLDADGRPAWESSPERFIEIPVLGPETQLGWMRSFAEGRPEAEGRALSEALDDPSGVSKFRRALTVHGVQMQWRAELQRRVVAEVGQWAQSHGVEVSDLVAVPRAAEAPRGLTRTATPRATPASPDLGRRGLDNSNRDLDRLRARLHAIIDRMSLTELAALPIRAEHLLAE